MGNLDETERQGEDIKKAARIGEETGGLLRGANNQQRKDRELVEGLLDKNQRIYKDLGQADGTIGEIERSVLLKIGLMYLAIAILGITILALLFKKVFY